MANARGKTTKSRYAQRTAEGDWSVLCMMPNVGTFAAAASEKVIQLAYLREPITSLDFDAGASPMLAETKKPNHEVGLSTAHPPLMG
jgi:hypothetical protein